MVGDHGEPWSGDQGSDAFEEDEWLEGDGLRAVLERMAEAVEDLTAFGEREAFGGDRRPARIAAQAFPAMEFSSGNADLGVKREAFE